MRSTSKLVLIHDDVLDCMSGDLVKVPATLYSLRRRNLPLSLAQTRAEFGATIQFFAGSAGGDDSDSNTVITNAPDQPFLLRCVSPTCAVEPVGFTANGEELDFPGTGSQTPYFDGIVPLTGGAGISTGVCQAYLEWGIATWKAAEFYFQTYRFTMPLGGVFVLFDELAMDIGTLDSHNTWGGYGDSLVALPEYVRKVNDQQRAGLTAGAAVPSGIFLPPTGQNQAAPGDTPLYAGVPTPMAQAAWGGPCMEGIWNGCYPAPGLLMPPGVPIYLNAVQDRGAGIYAADLQQAVQNAPAFTYDVNLTSVVATALTGGTVTGTAAFCKFIGGKLTTGATLRGANLTPRAVIEWYAMMSGMFRGVYGSVQMQNAINLMVDGVPGLDAVTKGGSITSTPKKDLLRGLAAARGSHTKLGATMGTLAGLPDNEHTKISNLQGLGEPISVAH